MDARTCWLAFIYTSQSPPFLCMAKLLTLLMASLLLVGTVSIGASAFTAATVERSASVDVVADNEGLLALTDGNSGNLVFQDGSTEQLGIDVRVYPQNDFATLS